MNKYLHYFMVGQFLEKNQNEETAINSRKAALGEYCPKENGLCWKFLTKKKKAKKE